MARISETGFTHTELHELRPDYASVWRTGNPACAVSSAKRQRAMAKLDECLARGLSCYVGLRPAAYLMRESGLREMYQRIDREGKPYRRPNICGFFPKVQQFCYDSGAGVGLAYGAHPAFAAAKIHDEMRDGTELCFHAHDREAFRRHSGREIPDGISTKTHVSGECVSEQVSVLGTVADDDSFVAFYQWFWRIGDGWNTMNSKASAGLKEASARPEIWTWHDPAVRAPALWGSGGEVDVISHWTYTYPDPLRMGLATDELLAMASGTPGQRVMKMTQVLWYRDQVAPRKEEPPTEQAEWELTEADARFITCAPDHLREAFWLKLSRPIGGIMYYGAGCLFGGGKQQRMTNARTRVVLRELIHEVIVPLGPTLLEIPPGPADVAMLESFTSMVFGGQPTWGWARGWAADVHQMLQWAGLQPCVIYEEGVLRDGLAGIRVLVLPDCPVLSRGVSRAIRRFQAAGGVVVGDRNLAAAVTPDILLEPKRRSVHTPVDAFKRELQAMAQQLRSDLAPVYTPSCGSSDPDVIVRRRSYGDTDYVFAVNDKRVFGSYVGHHRRVMEQGMSARVQLHIGRREAVVYDLVGGTRVPARSVSGGTGWTAELGPGGGGLYMISPSPIAGVHVVIQPRASTERHVHVRVTVRDVGGGPVRAVVPVEVRILDPRTEAGEFSGFYSAKDGCLSVELQLAVNDTRGVWTVHVRELAGGMSGSESFEYH